MSRAGRLLWLLVMIGCSWGTSTAGVPAGLTSKVVEVRGAADLPEFLLNDGQVQGLPYFKAHTHEGRKHKEKIVSFNGSAELSVKRTPARRYVTPDGYEGTEGDTLAEAMKLPEERGGLKLSRWVVCSWVIANISAAEALRARNIPFLDNIPELLRSVQNLSPSQVYAVAAANITMGFTFSGVNSSSLSPAAEDALKEAASDLAGGYSKSLITVSTSPPTAAISSQMEGKVQVQDAPDVVKRGKDLGQPAAALGTANGRRLQQAGWVMLQQGALGRSGCQHMRQRAAAAAVHRRLLQSAAAAAAPPAAPAAKSSSSSSSGELSVWLLYKHVAPANTSTLLTELCVSCNITPKAAAGTELTATPCGLEAKEALVGAGVGVDDATYSQTLSAPPTVSLSVRLAIGMTPAQVAAGDDVALAQWLAQPETTQAMARMYAPDAVVRWLHSPEVWYQKVAPPPPVLSPGAAAGVAVGGMAALCGVVGLAVWLLHRRKQQSNPADKDDGASSQGSGRRRRRQGKRRYLLPEPPRPGSQSHDDQAGPSSSGAAAAAGGSQEGSLADDEDPSPDQIRPHLRSLGDSVTSAVRFEQSDEEEANQDHTDGSAGASSSHAAAGAAGAAAAAVAAAAAAGISGSRSAADASSSTPVSSRSVLAARAAVLAEHQQAAEKPAAPTGGGQAGLAGSSRSSSGTAQACPGRGGVTGAASPAHAAVSPVPGAVSPELAAAAEMSSAVGTSSAQSTALNQPCATSSSSSAGAAAGRPAPGYTQQAPCLLKPVDERAAAASAAAVAAAAALPQAGAVAHPTSRHASPFAMSYNFDSLADAHPAAAAPASAAVSPVSLPGCTDPAVAAAAMAAASAGAVALPPRNVPLSPVCSLRSRLSAQPAGAAAAAPHNGTLLPQDAAAACGAIDTASSSSSSSSSTSSGQQQQLQLGALARSRSGGSPSSSSGLPSSPLDSSSGKKGVGLQQLVSITPVRGTEGAAAAAAAAGAAGACRAGAQQLNGTAYALGFQAQPETLWARSHSDCTSVLPTDSYQSTLQLSSSMSGLVLQPCSTNCVAQLSPRQSCEERMPDSNSSVGEAGVRSVGSSHECA